MPLLPGAVTWGKSCPPLKWILYYFGNVIARKTKTSSAEFLQLSHKPLLFALTSTTASHMAVRPSHTCADSPCEYLRTGYLWLRTDDKKCQWQSCVASDFAQLLLSRWHNQGAAVLWTESISWAFCLLTLSSWEYKFLSSDSTLGIIACWLSWLNPNTGTELFFLKHICSTEVGFAVILIILI